jgi:hypothetical protein
MKGIINGPVTLLAALMLLLLSCEKEEREIYSNEDGRFVRFNLQVDKDGQPIKPGTVNPSATVITFFNQKSVKSFAVPVTLTSEPLTEEVEVYFSHDTIGNYSAFSITPASGVLRFNGTDLSDTIYIDFTERWDDDVESQIILKLDSVSNDSIMIGSTNSIDNCDTLTINLMPLRLRYSFPVQNSPEIEGTEGETVRIAVQFPDGLFPSDLEGVELVLEESADFIYTISQEPFDEDATEIVYTLTLGETIGEDFFSFQVLFSVAELEDYILDGNNLFTITKPALVERDNAVNTAANFYNLADPFFRTYGVNWMDDNYDDICEWEKFNAFTFPVEVAASHPNAVLYDDKGTSDPDDDIYHHAFRIGFNTTNPGNTINSFNLKRWFENESNSGEYSSGFNITQALEFYPENGISTTTGTVLVIPQDLLISTRLEPDVYRSHIVSIEGEGTYMQIADGIFEITLELRATNEDLFGGTQKAHYRIYNTSEFDDPPDLTEGCFQPVYL